MALHYLATRRIHQDGISFGFGLDHTSKQLSSWSLGHHTFCAAAPALYTGNGIDMFTQCDVVGDWTIATFWSAVTQDNHAAYPVSDFTRMVVSSVSKAHSILM